MSGTSRLERERRSDLDANLATPWRGRDPANLVIASVNRIPDSTTGGNSCRDGHTRLIARIFTLPLLGSVMLFTVLPAQAQAVAVDVERAVVLGAVGLGRGRPGPRRPTRRCSFAA